MYADGAAPAPAPTRFAFSSDAASAVPCYPADTAAAASSVPAPDMYADGSAAAIAASPEEAATTLQGRFQPERTVLSVLGTMSKTAVLLPSLFVPGRPLSRPEENRIAMATYQLAMLVANYKCTPDQATHATASLGVSKEDLICAMKHLRVSHYNDLRPIVDSSSPSQYLLECRISQLASWVASGQRSRADVLALLPSDGTMAMVSKAVAVIRPVVRK